MGLFAMTPLGILAGTGFTAVLMFAVRYVALRASAARRGRAEDAE